MFIVNTLLSLLPAPEIDLENGSMLGFIFSLGRAARKIEIGHYVLGATAIIAATRPLEAKHFTTFTFCLDFHLTFGSVNHCFGILLFAVSPHDE